MHTIGTVPKPHSKIVERGKMDTPDTNTSPPLYDFVHAVQ
jgi:hypothetical protein